MGYAFFYGCHLLAGKLDAQPHEQAPHQTVEPAPQPGRQAHPAARIGSREGQQVAPDHAVEVEDAAKQNEGQRLLWRIWGNKLGHKGEEEERDLGIEHIGQQPLPKYPAIGEYRQGHSLVSSRRRLGPLPEHGKPQVDQIERPHQLDDGEQLSRGAQQSRQP